MPTTLHFEFYGDTQLSRTLENYHAVEDMTPAWEAIADDFAAAERRQFATEGAYGSGGWAPLSPAYAKWKASRYPGAKILHREGHLERSLTHRPFPIEVILPNRLDIGSDDPVGGYHQHGGGHLPRRRPVEWPESFRRGVVKTVQRFIRTGRPR